MISRILADFEMSYTTSFRNTAKIKYGVEFTNSHLPDVILNLKKLSSCIESNKNNNIHVGYDFGISEVKHILVLLTQLINFYSDKYSIDDPPPKKIYSLIDHIRVQSEKSSKEIAREIISDIISPKGNQKMTKKQSLEEGADRMRIAMAIKYSKK
jgi:hypothetical protein